MHGVRSVLHFSPVCGNGRGLSLMYILGGAAMNTGWGRKQYNAAGNAVTHRDAQHNTTHTYADTESDTYTNMDSDTDTHTHMHAHRYTLTRPSKKKNPGAQHPCARCGPNCPGCNTLKWAQQWFREKLACIGAWWHVPPEHEGPEIWSPEITILGQPCQLGAYMAGGVHSRLPTLHQ